MTNETAAQRAERERREAEAAKAEDKEPSKVRVDCDNCGATFAVRKSQADRNELFDCPFCRFRHYASDEAVAKSLQN